jgi:hypothetical protein
MPNDDDYPVWTGEDDLRPLLVPVEELRPDPKNVRDHGDRSIAVVRESLRTFGQQKPIVVGGDGETIAGAGTLQAAMEEGWSHVAAVRSRLEGDERRGYAIADNRTGEISTWDVDALAAELVDLGELAVGFSAEEVAAIIYQRSDGGDGSPPPTDPGPEWTGMPDYNHSDKTSVQRIVVHFATREDADAFGKAIGQNITEKTRSIWFPRAEIEHCMDKVYEDGGK